MIGDSDKGGDSGQTGVSPVHLNLGKGNGVVSSFVFPGVCLGFDWLNELTRRPRNEEAARTGAGCEGDSFVFGSYRGRVGFFNGNRGRGILVDAGMVGRDS
jgi:hypothetical protein